MLHRQSAEWRQALSRQTPLKYHADLVPGLVLVKLIQEALISWIRN
jgi:hypothetical protein